MELQLQLKTSTLKDVVEINDLDMVETDKLCLLKYKKTADFSIPLINECRGIILDKNTNNIVCYGLNKMSKDFDKTKLSECIVEDAIDGTQIRLYYFEDKWVVTTARCFTAERSRWNYVKSYLELFNDVKHLIDFSKLNKENTYTFILRHIENRIVEEITENTLYHIHTRNNKTLEEVEEDIGVKKPTTYKFDSFEDLEHELNYFTYNNMGYVIRYENKRYMFHSKEYDEIKELKGNNYNIKYHYFDLKKKNKLEDFLIYFPEYKILFEEVVKEFISLCEKIHSLYLQKFIKKEIEFKDMEKEFTHIVYHLHGIYRETGNKTTIGVVRDYINILHPGYILKLIKKNV